MPPATSASPGSRRPRGVTALRRCALGRGAACARLMISSLDPPAGRALRIPPAVQRRQQQEGVPHIMRKLVLACLALALASAALSGCRASAEVDPDGEVSYNRVVPR